MTTIELQPIHDEPALLCKEKLLLIIADLHIGIETELQQNGLQVPSQTGLMQERVIALIETYEITDLVILGDVKHNIPTASTQERSDVRRFLDALHDRVALHIIPGNHDGNLGRLLSPDITLYSSDGAVLDGIGLVHGHRWPSEEVMRCDQVAVAHTHPTIMLTDRLGYRTFEPCWLRASCDQKKLQEKYPAARDPIVFVLPAFNPLCGGIAVNTDPMLGPFHTLLDIPNALVYLLDGSALGKVRDIK
ncbi:MAG TPA: metallophosphoesterase [Candidatus Thermoplasmatota archaeon]|nr:metallophosphoesterase [Candidatus Thermoplasmatota archaeon]